MASHLALRSVTPSEQDIAQVLDNKHLLVNVVIFGDRANFALDSYVVMEQGGQTVKPVNVRFDARAKRSSVSPQIRPTGLKSSRYSPMPISIRGQKPNYRSSPQEAEKSVSTWIFPPSSKPCETREQRLSAMQLSP